MSNLNLDNGVTNTQSPRLTSIQQDEPVIAQTLGFAISIIFGGVGVIIAGIGIGGCLGAISGFNQVNAIIMVTSGGVGGIALLIVGIVGTVQTQAQKKAASEQNAKKEKTHSENDRVNNAKEKADKTQKPENENVKGNDEKNTKSTEGLDINDLFQKKIDDPQGGGAFTASLMPINNTYRVYLCDGKPKELWVKKNGQCYEYSNVSKFDQMIDWLKANNYREELFKPAIVF